MAAQVAAAAQEEAAAQETLRVHPLRKEPMEALGLVREITDVAVAAVLQSLAGMEQQQWPETAVLGNLHQ